MAKQSMNLVVLSGNIARDPEEFGEGDSKFVRCTLGMSNYKGERMFPSLVVYGRLAGVFMEHVKKGTAMTVQGYLQIRPYEQDGKTRYATDIVVREMFFGAFESAEESEVEPAPPPTRRSSNGNGQRSSNSSSTYNRSAPTRKPVTVEPDEEDLF
jgi:single-stranded DNA-binding protein